MLVVLASFRLSNFDVYVDPKRHDVSLPTIPRADLNHIICTLLDLNLKSYM